MYVYRHRAGYLPFRWSKKRRVKRNASFHFPETKIPIFGTAMLRVAVRRMASRAGIANDDLARKAMLEPTTAAHVGAEQYFRDAEREALEKRREALMRKTMFEEKERMKAAAIAAGTWKDPDVEEKVPFDLSDEAIRGGLMAVTLVATGAGLYFS